MHEYTYLMDIHKYLYVCIQNQVTVIHLLLKIFAETFEFTTLRERERERMSLRERERERTSLRERERERKRKGLR